MKKKTKITSTFIYFDTENKNGRIYPKKISNDILKQFKKKIKRGLAIGTLGYTDTFETPLCQVSHRITEIHFNKEKNSIDGTIELLETPMGIKAANILRENKDAFVVRSKGSGTINENKEVENYQVFSFDLILKDKDAFDVLKET
jgi:hypothetical protein